MSRFAPCHARVFLPRQGGITLTLAVLVLLLALVLGGVGLFVEALRWLLIVALVLLVVSFFTGRRQLA
jgi:hypothetical protein